MKIAITGGYGFLGWHLACRLRAVRGIEPIRMGRVELGDPRRAAQLLRGADAVVHIAGVNRAESDDAVERGNLEAAEQLAAVLPHLDRGVRVVNANSTQSLLENPYGRGKRAGADRLRSAVEAHGGSFVDVVLPNLYGEHGRPRYNSVVATFAHSVAAGESPSVLEDRELELLHAQSAAQVLIDAVDGPPSESVHPQGHRIRVSEILDRLNCYHALYERGDLPDLSDELDLNLFNTYRSFTFPDSFPRHPAIHEDARGRLFETSRAHGGTSQTFVSTTRPGQTRGNHYHLHKIERFFVVAGEAEIALRRLLDDHVVRFRVSGERPGFVDMPTLWTHSITNVGHDDLVTMFWSDQLLDPDHPDQYPEQVAPLEPEDAR